MLMFGKVRQKITPKRVWFGLLFLVLGALLFSLYLWHLGSLTRGLSPAEAASRSSSLSLQAIMNNPVYAPHKFIQYAVQKIFGHSPFELRITSVLFGLFFLGCIYHLVKGWFGKLISLYASLLLATIPWFVLLVRSATPQILFFLPLAAICFYYWLVHSKSSVAWLALAIASAAMVYLPGGLYLLILGLVFARKNLASLSNHLRLWPKVLGILVGLLLLTPLIYGLVQHPVAVKPIALITADWPGVVVTLKSIAWGSLALFWRLPLHLDNAVDRLPMLNGAQIVLASFGGFALLKMARSKLFLLLGLVLSAILLAAIAQDYLLLSLALPATVVLMAGGLRYLYLQWRSIFPKNPLPNYLALTLISLLVGLHILYGVRYSLYAWPNTSATRATYVLK